jgi:LmbE family N-acetylglucosaminyl deacetylase
MNLSQPDSEVYIPGGGDPVETLARTTHLAIGAHPDDLEIMAIAGILACYQRPDARFTGVVVTDGAGSPRGGAYAHISDEEMQNLRVLEQRRAAHLGDYGAQLFLGFPSRAAKDPVDRSLVADLQAIVTATRPGILYTHNLADKHPTHVGVAVKVIKALRGLPAASRPQKVYGCEVWRDLGWLVDEDKVVFDCSERQNLQLALLGVFDSQISGGKRYDLAAMGRRVANATFHQSHQTDRAQGLVFAMDLGPLVEDPQIDISAYVRGYIERFSADVFRLIESVL